MSEQTQKTEIVTESKHELVIGYLRTEDSAGKSNGEIAALFACNEGTVRRARKMIEAEAAAHKMIARGADGGEAKDVLHAILAADRRVDELLLALEECKEEQKEIKAAIADANEQARAVRRKAVEQFPLIEKPKSEGPRLALPA